jgi:hypothetical protein
MIYTGPTIYPTFYSILIIEKASYDPTYDFIVSQYYDPIITCNI